MSKIKTISFLLIYTTILLVSIYIMGFVKFLIFFFIGWFLVDPIMKGLKWILNYKKNKEEKEDLDRKLIEERTHRERVLRAFKR